MKYQIDFSGLTDFTGGDPSFSSRLLSAFRVELNQLIWVLEKLPTTGDTEAVSKKYHSVQPSLTMLKLDLLVEKIAEYRKRCAEVMDTHHSGPIKAMNEINELVGQISENINQYLASISGADTGRQ